MIIALSKDLNNLIGKKVVLIGKVIDIVNEKKFIKIKLLDKYGYIDLISFEYFDIKLFDTVMVIGLVKTFNNETYVKVIDIINFYSIDDELFWRKAFINKYKKRMKSKKIVSRKKVDNNAEEKTNNEEKIFYDQDAILYENKEILLRKKILDFIRNFGEKDGVSFEDILKNFDIGEEKLYNIIKELLSAGEIYEVSQGRYKAI